MISLLAAFASWPLHRSIQDEPLFDGLGNHHRAITTTSQEAQKYFDQGLNFLYAFNHDEAIASFTQATRLDPQCPMAWWGIAIANGPHINNPTVDDAHAKAAWDALLQAKALASLASKTERDLIRAAGARYAYPQPENRGQLDRSYAKAMRAVWQRHPKDADVGALFAESMMDLRPWDLWLAKGTPQPGTQEIVKTLASVLKSAPMHPLANHLNIHAWEASPNPYAAVPSANILRDLQPGLGHNLHMPSHIDVRTGQWRKAIASNEKAIAADMAYHKLRPEQGFYTIYMVHNHHMLAYAATMRGESTKAISTMRELQAMIPEEVVKSMAAAVDAYMAMPLEVLVRFGRWDEVLAAPEFPDYLPIARTLRHGARAVSYAAKGLVEEAKSEQRGFYIARSHVAPGASAGNSKAADVMRVAEHLMNGEILLSEGKMGAAIFELRKAVRAEDALRYDEPPDWLQPTRHTLGAALSRAGRFDEAIAVYREDLRKLPNNGWSLFGLANALEKTGRYAEAIPYHNRFELVWADADIVISSSCMCLPQK